MVKTISPEELSKVIQSCYKRKVPLFVQGPFGIGKSQITESTAKEIAQSKNKEYRNWNKISRQEKDEIFKNPSKYFVLIDERLSEYDSSDIKGLPDFTDGKESIEWKIPLWAKFITLEGSDGVLFFDEVNLAPDLVIASVYKIILDRIVNDTTINPNWIVIGAGNREEDMAHTHLLPAPVKDRWCEVELRKPETEEWTEWAIKRGIDSRIISFLQFKSSSLYSVNFEDNQKFTTPRGWERVSTLIKGDNDINSIDLLSKTAIGEGIAQMFISFCKIQHNAKIQEMIDNPEKLRSLEGKDNLDVKWFLVGAVADQYKDKRINFTKVIDISKVLDEMKNDEFVALMWKMAHQYSERRFGKELVNDKKLDANSSFVQKYWTYLA